VYKGKEKLFQDVNVSEQYPVKSEKAKGNKLNFKDIKKVEWLPSLPEPDEAAEFEITNGHSHSDSVHKEVDFDGDDLKLF
jgi:hypothetical protein